MKHGMAPPRPTPAKSLTTISIVNESARAVASVNRPNSATAMASMRLRPKMSPSSPNPNAPTAAPRAAAEKIGPSAARESLRMSATIGAATAIDCVSIPSRKATIAHVAITAICNDDIGRRSINLGMSIGSLSKADTSRSPRCRRFARCEWKRVAERKSEVKSVSGFHLEEKRKEERSAGWKPLAVRSLRCPLWSVSASRSIISSRRFRVIAADVGA